MKNCSVCGSPNLNGFAGDVRILHWCEDCGTLHRNDDDGFSSVSTPEHSMLHHQVLAFHRRFGQSIGEKPHVPDEKTVRFRLSLIAEEFFELLEAAHINPVLRDRDGSYLLDPNTAIAKDYVMRAIREDYTRDGHGNMIVDLPEFVDAVGDLMYVLEGTAIVAGVDMLPVFAEIQRANLSKEPAYVQAKDEHHLATGNTIKPTKPAGWYAPGIAGELRRQGWIE